jgi:zinc transport system ATP-binding protein
LNILEVRDLSVCFGVKRVIDHLTFSVSRATSLAVIGPNGVGKTVLLKALIGSIPFDGHVGWAAGTRVGYVPQKLDLERDIPLTGLDFLGARGRLAHARTSEIARMSEVVGVSQETLRQPIGSLSGGQFQRLLVAFALVGEPNVLLLDEPTASLDEAGGEHLYEVVTRLKRDRNLTIVFISHELSVVYEYADEVLCLARQRVFQGPPRQILTPELMANVYGAPLRFHVHDG